MVLGFGGAATIVGMKVLSLYGEQEAALAIRNVVEAFALPRESKYEKDYLFGALPIVDAFITWSHSGMIRRDIPLSFTVFRVYSVVAFALMSVALWMLTRRKRRRNEETTSE